MSAPVEVSEQPVASGPPLAVVPTMKYTGTTLSLRQGEGLLFYTDGLTDSTQAETGTRLGENGARRLLEKGFANPALVVETLLAGEATHRGDAPPQDDLTLLAFGFRE